MMILRILALAFLLLSAVSATSQTLTVRSGEHETFTRLVVPVPNGSVWRIDQIGRQVSLTIEGFAGRFATNEVFDLIPRERVTDITASGDALEISLGCDCQAASFVTADRFVVVDIGPQDAALVGTPVTSVDPEPTGGTTSAQSIVSPEVEMPKAKVDLPLIIERSETAPSARIEPLDVPLRARDPLSPKEQSALTAMQQRLLKELSVAATRGVLTPNPGQAIPDLATEPEAIAPTEKAEAPTPLPDIVYDAVNNLRVTSSNDLTLLEQSNRDSVSLAGQTCVSNEDINVASWADERPFFQQISEARQMLYGEFDRLNREGAIALAQTYIHFGFGAEALQILALDPSVTAAEPLLVDVAHIMEYGKARPESPLPASLDCKTDIALWAALARSELTVAGTIDPSPALLALNKLPVHLRKFLAPALSARFLSHGDSDAAAKALRSVERLPSAPPAAAKLARAHLEIEKGDVAAGTDALADVIDDNAEQSPAALITLVETKLRQNQPIDPETARLVEAYAKELKGSDLGPALRRAHVLALVKSGQYDRAFDAMETLGARTEEADAVDLRLAVLKELTETAEDVVFLEHLFAQDDRDIERLPVRPKLALAQRLFDLGFAARAEVVLETIPARPVNAVRQLLIAEIALQFDQPQRALAQLGEIPGNAADALRAQAKLEAGAHQEAAALFRQIDQPEAAVTATWLGEGGETLVEDPLFGAMVSLGANPPEPVAGAVGMLQRSDEALNESAQARETILNLLSKPQLSVPTATEGG